MERLKRLIKALKNLERKEVQFYAKDGKIFVQFEFAADGIEHTDFYKRYKGIKGDEFITKAVKHLLEKEIEEEYKKIKELFSEVETLLKEAKEDEPEEAF